ncbi:MAG: glycosyltransferase family 2 protein [Rhodobacterales bacterium]|nr:glycosyltransferase family 2 protein [Rhodobacterales bacterium]
MFDITLPPDPQVSVLLAVYNGRPYLEAALRSIMDQSLKEIEIVVVDDASTDDTPAVLAQLAAEDPRIRVETLSQNCGPARARNWALDLVRAPLVAIMDADDIAYPERLAVQKRFMDAHPDIILCGTSIRQIDADGTHIRTSRRPRDAVCCRWLSRFAPPLMHPTYMFRYTGALMPLPKYNPDFPVAQDYEFLIRLLGHGDVVGLGDVLLDYRVHGTSITGKNWSLQKQKAREISMDYCEAELSKSVRDGLNPFWNAYFLGDITPKTDIFSGLRRMLTEDLRRYPDHRAWLQRQTAQIALAALKRGGCTKGQILRAFATQGRDFLPALAMRALEIKRVLPAALRSDSNL